MSNSNLEKFSILKKLKKIKHIEFIILGIFVFVLGCIYFSSGSNPKNNSDQQSGSSLEDYADYLETKLCKVISALDGVGSANVMITFDGDITYEYAIEKEEVTTSSSVSGGANSKTTIKEEIVIVNKNGVSTPLVIREIYPNIDGVVVVYNGANDVAVKLNIVSVVQTLINVKFDKIQVFFGDKK